MGSVSRDDTDAAELQTWVSTPIPRSAAGKAEWAAAGEQESLRAWRVEILPPQGRFAPFLTGYIYYEDQVPGTIIARCGRGHAHTAPDPGCTCGIYACDRVESLISMLRAAEGTLGAAAAFARRRRLDTWWYAARVAVLQGTLKGALPIPDAGRQHRTFPLYNDNLGNGIGGALAHIALGGTREVLCYAVTGDPPGTWRGASFTTEHAVIMTFLGDKPKDYRDLLPCKTKLVTASAPDELLSARMKRHAASGSSDHRWWRA